MAFLAPIAALGLPALLSAGAGIVGGVSQIMDGNYQAAVGRNNAAIAEYNSAVAGERGQTEAMRSDIENAAAVGEQMARQGASGLDMLGRTQIATRGVQQRVGRERARDIRGASTAEARQLLQEGANYRAAGKAAKRQGYIKAAGSFLQAGSSLVGGTGVPQSLATRRSRRSR